MGEGTGRRGPDLRLGNEEWLCPRTLMPPRHRPEQQAQRGKYLLRLKAASGSQGVEPPIPAATGPNQFGRGEGSHGGGTTRIPLGDNTHLPRGLQ